MTFIDGMRMSSWEPCVRLMLQAGRGDREAFTRVYELYYTTVRDFFVSRSRPGGPIDDLTQEVFSRAWRSAARFRGASAVKTYLLGIAINVLREHCARSARDRSLRVSDETLVLLTDRRTSDNGLTEVEQARHRKDLQVLVAKKVARLSPLAREAIEMTVFEGLSTREAAAKAGCSLGAFRQRLRWALQRLRSTMPGMAARI